MYKPKVLVFDIETSPLIAYVWALKDQNITTGQIIDDWSVLAWGAKWLGDPASKVMYMDQRNKKDMRDDRDIVKAIWKLLDEADIVITQNGKNFDSPRLNARFIEHGLPPPSPYRHLDTYLIARNAADFTSKKLEYLTAKLCKKYKKLTHSKYPGWSLWVECLKNNLSAWNEMKKYNIHDVLSTEELYLKLRAWAPANAPKPFEGHECSICGEFGTLVKYGIRYTGRVRYQRLMCTGCGAWSKEKVK
jgi:DNA polymerase elongation subunit (family B)